MVLEKSILRRIEENMKNLMESQIRQQKMFLEFQIRNKNMLLEFQSRNEKMFLEALNRTTKVEKDLLELKTISTQFMQRQGGKPEATMLVTPKVKIRGQSSVPDCMTEQNATAIKSPLNPACQGNGLVPMSSLSPISVQASVEKGQGNFFVDFLMEGVLVADDYFKRMFNFKKGKADYWTWVAGNLTSGGRGVVSFLLFVYSLDYARKCFSDDAKIAKAGDEKKFIWLFIFCPLCEPP